jgi:hypothetical protein
MTNEPEEQEQPQEEEQEQEDSLESKDRERQEHAGQAWWKAGDAPKWPLWLLLGMVAVVVIVVLVVGVVVPRWAQPPAATGKVHLLTTTAGPDVPANPTELIINGIYSLSAPTPLCEQAGADVNGAGVKMLPANSQIGIVRTEMVENTKWYYVEAADSMSSPKGKGWVSSGTLAGQKLMLVRDILDR